MAPRASKSGATAEIRIQRIARFKGKVRRIRQVQQSENGLVEFPFGLFNASGEKLKQRYMTERDAAIRNSNIKSMGYVWRRCGY